MTETITNFLEQKNNKRSCFLRNEIRDSTQAHKKFYVTIEKKGGMAYDDKRCVKEPGTNSAAEPG